MAETVKVIVRCRPMNSRENALKCKPAVEMDSKTCQVRIKNLSDQQSPPKAFTFDGVYYVDSTAEQVYNEICYPLVESVLEGYNGTIFAYGQTGSGKTFTMQGVEQPPAQRGVIPRTFEHIFESTATTADTKYLVHASYIEIYNEEVRDLLGGNSHQKLEIKEHPDKGVYVGGLSMHAVHNTKECEGLMQMGFGNRHVAATLMNAESSRSHSIFTIHLEMMNLTPAADGEEHIRIGKLHLVDLAGSERQSKTGATGDRLKEANKINLSLSALGNVISILVDGKSKHIPYRDSKLTRLLQDSLGGNTKTIMIACCSPADNNYDETLSTLRYANRAKNIKNKPKINEDPKDALLREYQDEIKRLKEMVNGTPQTIQRAPSVDVEAEKAKLREEFEAQMEEMKKEFHQERQSKAELEKHLKELRSEHEVAQKALEAQSAAEILVNEMKSPKSSPTHKKSGNNDIDPAEAKKRLEMLQHQMVGGEQADNKQLKDKRDKKKQNAEKRMQKLAEALSSVKSDDPMLQVYNNVQDKLEAVTGELDKERTQVRTLEVEVHDIQQEFEADRIDYLETIRRQERQLLMLQQMLDKVQPLIRRDCNYANLDRIKVDARWDEENGKWIMPELTIQNAKLPNAIGGGGGGMMPGGRVNGSTNNGISPRPTFTENGNDLKLKSRLEQSALEDVANNYFKTSVSSRTAALQRKSDLDRNRQIEQKSYMPQQRTTWEGLMSGVVYTNDIYERPNSEVPSNDMGRKPQRLEAISHGNNRSQSAKRKIRKY